MYVECRILTFESVHVAYIGDKVVIFVGNERPGSIAIFSIDNEVTKPKFQSLWVGIEETNGTWEELYNRRKISEIDPAILPGRSFPTNMTTLSPM
jgi:hypothetical protein